MSFFSQDTFSYDSKAWSSMSPVSPENGDTGLDQMETLLPTYWSTPFSKICLGMKVDGVTRFLPLHREAASLYFLIADGQYQRTSLGRNAWKKLIGPSASLQRNCNREGFNSQGSDDKIKTRIGIIANQEGDCKTPDSFIGFGGAELSFKNVCGNRAAYFPDHGNKNTKAFGYIFVQ